MIPTAKDQEAVIERLMEEPDDIVVRMIANDNGAMDGELTRLEAAMYDHDFYEPNWEQDCDVLMPFRSRDGVLFTPEGSV